MKTTNNWIGKLAFCALGLLTLTTSCSKKDNPAEEPEKPVNIVPKISAQGQPLGLIASKQVGPAGGAVASTDNTITLSIPAGALAANTAIGIQPITNTNIAGKGRAFRLTPHGQQFAKPVTITFSYAAFQDSLAFPLTAGIAYQDDAGVWQLPGGSIVDTVAKKVTYQTTHFSDWALMETISLRPVSATLGQGEKMNIEALLYNALPNPCNCLEDLLAPLVPGNNPYPVGEPAPLPKKYIKRWKLVGPGSLSATTGNKVEYRAPASISGTKTATVIAELNGPDKGNYWLVATITLMDDGWIEQSLAGGAPVRFPATPCVRIGEQYYLSNPEDEGGGYFGMKWIGGLGTHAFDMNNTTTWHYNTAATGYVSMYLPDRDSPLKASGGGITITQLGNGMIEGTFLVSNAGYNNFLSTTSASGKFRVKLFIKQ